MSISLSPALTERMAALQQYAEQMGRPIPPLANLVHAAIAAGLDGMENGTVPLPEPPPRRGDVVERARRAASPSSPNVVV